MIFRVPLQRALSFSLLLALQLLPVNAHAHLVSMRFGEFYNGMLHPVITLGHLLPFLAIALLTGLQAQNNARRSLWVFPLAVLCGATLAQFNILAPVASTLNMVSLLLFGLLVVLAPQLRAYLLFALLGVFGLSHGFANGEVELTGRPILLYFAGVVTVAYVLMTLVTALSQLLVQRFTWGGIAVRAMGSWIFAVGLIFVAFTLLQPQPVVTG